MSFNNSVNANTAGYQVLSGAGVWTGRTLTAGTGINITNGDGTVGNPVISATATGNAAWTFIETQAGAATNTFNTSLTTYTELMFVFDDLACSSQNVTIKVSTDNGSTNVTLEGGLFVGHLPATTYASATSQNLSGVVVNGVYFGQVNVQNVSGTRKKPITSNLIESAGTADYLFTQLLTASSAQLNWVQFAPSAGSFGTGNIILYGRG